MPQPLADLPLVHQVYLAAAVAMFIAYPLALAFAFWTAYAPDKGRSRRRLGEECAAA